MVNPNFKYYKYYKTNPYLSAGRQISKSKNYFGFCSIWILDFSLCLINQHNRDIVLDRIFLPALFANYFFALQLHIPFAGRTRQDIQKFFIDHQSSPSEMITQIKNRRLHRFSLTDLIYVICFQNLCNHK